MNLKSVVSNLQSAKASVLVLGLGISGIEAANFLISRSIKVVCVEKQARDQYFSKTKWSESVLELEKKGVQLCFGVDGEEVSKYLDDIKLAVLSPGLSLESAVVAAIQRAEVPWVSELELGVELHDAASVVVTGSNGKSTTSTLIHSLLEAGGKKSFLCGNVGVPVISSEYLNNDSKKNLEYLVVEASSYQLEACAVLKPRVAVLMNISENHLERHGTIARYAAAKAKVFAHQDGSDLAIINADDNLVREIGMSCKARKVLVGFGAIDNLKSQSKDYIKIDAANHEIIVSLNGANKTFSTKGSKLLGRHNQFNIAVGIAAALDLDVSDAVIQKVILEFSPLEHRMELVVEKPTIVINDSKSTTVAASVAALSTAYDVYPGKNVRLMIGGLSKAGSWEPLLSLIERSKDKTSEVICFGKDAKLLANHCKAKGIAYVVSETLKEATLVALKTKNEKDVVLLSPGCASFDEFSDFEDRGRKFKGYVSECI